MLSTLLKSLMKAIYT